MTTQKYWMRSDTGDLMQVGSAAERDSWLLRNWQESKSEPSDRDQVWFRVEGVENPAKFPWGAREFWGSRGWEPSTPPEPIDYTRDPRVVDVAEAPPVSEPAKSAVKKESK
jgi:hypothetical protein